MGRLNSSSVVCFPVSPSGCRYIFASTRIQRDDDVNKSSMSMFCIRQDDF